MSSSNLAISVKGLSKDYRIVHQAEKATTLGEALANRLRNPLRSVTAETFQALNDVSFDVAEGEVLGIIGRNGAGKSTLLKVLSRITEPTSGEVRMRGRVASLLEVGTGFHPELTGRENILLNGSILGMRRREVDRQFDAIVEFADVDRFLDTPVKRYSSGMYVRLAFAVAAHLNPEILIVDEVLAVGDAQFQKKCLGKMQDVSRQDGRTVLFVSHNMASIQTLCTSGLLLGGGRVLHRGSVDSVVSAYLSSGAELNKHRLDLRTHSARSSDLNPWVEWVEIRDGSGEFNTVFGSTGRMSVAIGVRPPRPIHDPRIAVAIEDQLGRRICTFATYFDHQSSSTWREPFIALCDIPRLALGPGRYMLSLSVAETAGLLDSIDGATWFEVEWDGSYPTGEPFLPHYGPVIARSEWTMASASPVEVVK